MKLEERASRFIFRNRGRVGISENIATQCYKTGAVDIIAEVEEIVEELWVSCTNNVTKKGMLGVDIDKLFEKLRELKE